MAALRPKLDTQKEVTVISYKDVPGNEYILHQDLVVQILLDKSKSQFNELYGGSFMENEQSILHLDEPLSGFREETNHLVYYCTQLKNGLASGTRGAKYAVVGFIGHGNVERAICNTKVIREVLAEFSSIYKIARKDNPLKHLVIKFRGCMVDEYCKSTRFRKQLQLLRDENKDLPIVISFCGMNHTLSTTQIFWSETGCDEHMVRRLTQDFRKAGMGSAKTYCKMPTVSVITLTENAEVITMRTEKETTGVMNTYIILNPDTGCGMWSGNCKGLSIQNGGYHNQIAKILWYFPFIKSKSGIPEEFLSMKPEHFVSRKRNWVKWKHIPNVVVKEYQNMINMENNKVKEYQNRINMEHYY